MRLFNRRTKSPFLNKIEKIVRTKIGFKNVNRLFFLKAIEIKNENLSLIVKRINNNKVIDVVNEGAFNMHSSNLEFYIIERIRESDLLMLIVDHYEPFRPEEFVGLFEVSNHIIDQLKTKSKLIFE